MIMDAFCFSESLERLHFFCVGFTMTAIFFTNVTRRYIQLHDRVRVGGTHRLFLTQQFSRCAESASALFLFSMAV